MRDGMQNLVNRLRGYCDAGTADYTIGAITYWTEDQLLDALDGARIDVLQQPLSALPRQASGGSAVWHDYYFPAGDLGVEEAASGTAAWLVEDSTGADIGTANYTVNYRTGHIRFTQNTAGTAYYLTYRQYDLAAAAADVWQMKAGHVSSRFDVKTDNHDLKRSQLHAMCMANAKEWRSRARARSVHMVRDDVNG